MLPDVDKPSFGSIVECEANRHFFGDYFRLRGVETVDALCILPKEFSNRLDHFELLSGSLCAMIIRLPECRKSELTSPARILAH